MEILDDNGLNVYESPGALNRAIQNKTMRGRIHRAQGRFLNGAVDVGIHSMHMTGDILIAGGYFIAPYAPHVGGVVMAAGGSLNLAESGLNFAANAIRGNYGEAGLSFGSMVFGRFGSNLIGRIPYTNGTQQIPPLVVG